jgi:outer membrane lipoprotein SlyB
MRTLYATLEGRRPVPIDVKARFNETTFGNIIAGGVGGVALDTLSGRSVRYEDSVFIEFPIAAE